MDSSFFGALVALLLFSQFVKFATVLSVFRYGAGLVGFELGVVTLVAALGLAFATLPREVRGSGAAVAIVSGAPADTAALRAALVPTMAASLDPQIVKGLYGADASLTPESLKSDLGRLLPAYTLSQLKSALVLGVMLLIPFVLLDLVVVHVLSLLGIQQIGAQVVSLPLKLLLFLAIDGWGLLGAKLLAGGA